MRPRYLRCDNELEGSILIWCLFLFCERCKLWAKNIRWQQTAMSDSNRSYALRKYIIISISPFRTRQFKQFIRPTPLNNRRSYLPVGSPPGQRSYWPRQRDNENRWKRRRMETIMEGKHTHTRNNHQWKNSCWGACTIYLLLCNAAPVMNEMCQIPF